MQKLMTILILPVAFAGFAACGEFESEAAEDIITLDEATYLAALEGEDLGSEDAEPEDPSVDDATEDVNACSFDQIKKRVRKRFDRNKNGDIDPREQEEMNASYDDEEETDDDQDGEVRRHKRVKSLRDRADNKRRGHRHHKLRRIRWIYDADNSRSLDAAEKATLHADIEARCANIRARHLERFDSDADGTLSAEERRSAHEAKRTKRKDRRDAFTNRVDSDNDGHVSKAEKRDARKARRNKRHNQRDTIKTRFDADGDDTLSDDEKTALRSYLREWIRGEHLGEPGPDQG